MPVQPEQQVIALDAGRGKAQHPFLVCFTGEQFFQGSVVQVGTVGQIDGLFPLRKTEIKILHQRAQAFTEIPPAPVHIVGMRRHPFGKSVEQQGGSLLFLQQPVALQEQLIIGLNVLQIGPVDLGEDEIEVFAPLLAGIVDEPGIERRDHHDGQQADMLGKAGVGLGAAAEGLLPAPANGNGDFFLRSAIHLIKAAERRLAGTVGIHILVGGRKVAFGHRQIIDGVQQVRFAGSVAPVDIVDLGRKTYVRFCNILEIVQDDSVYKHVKIFCHKCTEKSWGFPFLL